VSRIVVAASDLAKEGGDAEYDLRDRERER
jgi:hypothetical protein